jgi:hypothetical protein
VDDPLLTTAASILVVGDGGYAVLPETPAVMMVADLAAG